jgi:hypothetical protein
VYATIIDPQEEQQKASKLAGSIRGVALSATGLIKESANKAVEIAPIVGSALQKTTINAGLSLKEKVSELPEVASELGKKSAEWLDEQSAKQAERKANEHQEALERMEREHVIKIKRASLDLEVLGVELEKERIRKTGGALIDRNVRAIRDEAKGESQRQKQEERQRERDRQYALKETKLEAKITNDRAKIAAQQTKEAERRAEAARRYALKEAKLEAKKEKQRRRQRTLTILGISAILIVAIVLFAIVYASISMSPANSILR